YNRRNKKHRLGESLWGSHYTWRAGAKQGRQNHQHTNIRGQSECSEQPRGYLRVFGDSGRRQSVRVGWAYRQHPGQPQS
ncbi:hypothetical protein SARC_15449, partial [Sphaeroforma arctica JP610]